MLQQVSRKPVFVPPDRQARMLAEVRGLLEITASERVAGQDVMNMGQFHAPQLGGVPRQHRFSRLVTFIAAVLVIGALIVTDLLFFHPWFSSTSRPRPPVRPDRFVISSTYPIAKDYSLNGVPALSANDVWAVGYETDNNGLLIENWDGSGWSVVKSPGSGTDNALYGMDHGPHSNTIIIVGTMY